MAAKTFSLEQAHRLLPKVRPLVAQLKEASGQLRDANARVQATVQRHGEDKVDSPANPERAAYWKEVGQARAIEERLQALLDEVQFLGVEVKDLDLGLVDFRSRRGSETVYLCWRLGEERIQFWHDLQSGFAGRRPVEELEREPQP